MFLSRRLFSCVSFAAILGASVPVWAQSNTEILFRVNMNLVEALGIFDPAVDAVVLRGEINGWECSEPLKDDDGDGTYELEIQAPDVAAGMQAYKFNINCTDAGWESVDDRTFTVTGQEADGDGDGFGELVLEDPFFDNIGPGNHDVEVTFEVDMTLQIALGNFSPDSDTVVVRGELNDWNCSEAMEDLDGDGVYSIQVAQPGAAVALHNYKFNRGCAADGWESIDDRTYRVTGREPDDDGNGLLDVVAPRVFFNDESKEAEQFDVEVFFQANMNVQIAQGTFDPTNDTVVLRGQINDWGCSELTDEDDDGIYEISLSQEGVEAGSFEYKFNINCTDAGWESGDNRTYEIVGDEPDDDGNGFLNLVNTRFFNDVEVAVTTQDVQINFAVDMTIQIGLGAFDPDADTIVVRGGFNSFGCSEAMEDDDGDGIYRFSAMFENVLSGEHPYKFNINCADAGWETGNDRTYTVTADLPDTDGDGVGEVDILRAFNDLTQDDVLQQDVLVIFSVDLSAVELALRRGVQFSAGGTNVPNFSQVTGVGVTGPWFGDTPWNWENFTEENLLLDDGADFDEIPGDLVYTGAVVVAAGTAKRIEYKYGLVTATTQGIDGEAGREQNHQTLLSDASKEFFNGTDCFGSQNQDATIRLGDAVDGFTCVRSVGPFLRGDCDQTGVVDLTSGVFLLNFLFQGGVNPPCLAACNANLGATLDISTGVYVFNWLFLGGPIPPQPSPIDPECGYSADPRDMALGCEDPSGCTS